MRMRRSGPTRTPLTPDQELKKLRRQFVASPKAGRATLAKLAPLLTTRWCSTTTEQANLAAMILDESEPEPTAEQVKVILALASSILPNQACPCGSGQDVEVCCYVRASPLGPRRAGAITGHPPTGMEVQRCYARTTGDCQRPLSREHFLSKCVINEFARDCSTIGLTLTGFAGLRGASLSPDAMAPRVLCEKHNNALSSLDAVGCEFIRALKSVAVAAHERKLDQLELRRSFYGPDIERWMLKILLGLLASGGAMYRGRKVPRTQPPPDLVEILFGRRGLPILAGLVLVPAANFDLPADHGASIALTPFAWGGQPAALALRAWGFGFVMAARPPSAGPDALSLADGFYRPRQIWVHNAKDVRIDLEWDQPWNGPVALLSARVDGPGADRT